MDRYQPVRGDACCIGVCLAGFHFFTKVKRLTAASKKDSIETLRSPGVVGFIVSLKFGCCMTTLWKWIILIVNIARQQERREPEMDRGSKPENRKTQPLFSENKYLFVAAPTTTKLRSLPITHYFWIDSMAMDRYQQVRGDACYISVCLAGFRFFTKVKRLIASSSQQKGFDWDLAISRCRWFHCLIEVWLLYDDLVKVNNFDCKYRTPAREKRAGDGPGFKTWKPKNAATLFRK